MHAETTWEEELEQHIERCAKSRPYYFASELSVISEAKESVRFGKLWPTQKKIQDTIDGDLVTGRPTRLIILKARRHRISTLMAANIFHAAAFTPNSRSYIVAHDNDTTGRLFEMHKIFMDNLSPELRPMIRGSNAREIRFENPDSTARMGNPGLRSSIVVRCAAGGSRKMGDLQAAAGVGRGDRIDCFHGSEVAFWPDGEQTFRGFAAAVPDEPGTLVAMESTGNGAGGFFYSAWREAMDDGEYTPFFLPWFDHPEYRASSIARNRPEWMPTEEEEKWFEEYLGHLLLNDPGRAEKAAGNLDIDQDERDLVSRFHLDWDQLKWRRHVIRAKFQGKVGPFRSEFPSTWQESFASSGTPRFNNQKIRIWMEKALQPFHANIEPAEGVDWKWEDAAWKETPMRMDPHPKGVFHIFEPVMEGHQYIIGGDASHGVGRDSSALSVFDRTGKKIVATASDPHLKADTLAALMLSAGWYYNCAWLAPEFNGPGVLTSHLIVQSGYPRVYYSQRWNSSKSEFTMSPGFVTDHRSRDLLIDRFDIAIERDEIDIPDAAVLQEALTFMLDPRNNRADHLPGTHDDLLFATMIALFVDQQVALDVEKKQPEKLMWRRTPPTVDEVLDDIQDDSEQLAFL